MTWDFAVSLKAGRVSDQLISVWMERIYRAAGWRRYLYSSQVGLSYHPSVCHYLMDRAE